MNDNELIIAMDPTKIDIEDAVVFLNAYKNPTKILIHLGVIERIAMIMQGKKSEIQQLSEIVSNSITHCSIVEKNPTADTYDETGEINKVGPPIYSPEYINHARILLPQLIVLHSKILALI